MVRNCTRRTLFVVVLIAPPRWVVLAEQKLCNLISSLPLAMRVKEFPVTECAEDTS
jgi:hypothetical protein